MKPPLIDQGKIIESTADMKPETRAGLIRMLQGFIDFGDPHMPEAFKAIVALLKSQQPKEYRMAENIGEALLFTGKITVEQLSEALVAQRTSGKYLGQIFVELDMVSQSELMSVLVSETMLPYLLLGNYEIDFEAVKMVPEELCRTHQLLPLSKVVPVLSIGIIDPFKFDGVKIVMDMYPNLMVKAYMCKWQEHQALFARIFPMQPQFQYEPPGLARRKKSVRKSRGKK